MSLLRFKISGAEAVDVSGTADFTTDWQELYFSTPFSISLTNTVVGGSPTFSVEVSNDAIQSYPHSAAATSVAINSAFEASDIGWKYVRVKYTNVAATSGVVNPYINISQHKVK